MFLGAKIPHAKRKERVHNGTGDSNQNAVAERGGKIAVADEDAVRIRREANGPKCHIAGYDIRFLAEGFCQKIDIWQ